MLFRSLSRSNDLVNWTTCSVNSPKDGDTFDAGFYSIQLRYAPNDRLYMLWQQNGDNSYGKGLMLWREQ